jgi:hypothetical protein
MSANVIQTCSQGVPAVPAGNSGNTWTMLAGGSESRPREDQRIRTARSISQREDRDRIQITRGDHDLDSKFNFILIASARDRSERTQ